MKEIYIMEESTTFVINYEQNLGDSSYSPQKQVIDPVDSFVLIIEMLITYMTLANQYLFMEDVFPENIMDINSIIKKCPMEYKYLSNIKPDDLCMQCDETKTIVDIIINNICKDIFNNEELKSKHDSIEFHLDAEMGGIRDKESNFYPAIISVYYEKIPRYIYKIKG